ncbi:MAG TPA: ParA family protein [Allosphingosinicella sp.]|jgi:cellulose biosynthesis protein BcsQ|uniref:ParA family protein n=1 Tax=Allosphingosinicella sp. TaxID=2823234 RepID=UPI002F2A5F28
MARSRSVAIYSLKGGVGKTTFAVNLAWAAAAQSGRSTLLWDLDAQAAATFLLRAGNAASEQAQAVFAREIAPERLIRPSAIAGLDVLPADRSLRGLDSFFFGLGKKRRLERLLGEVGREHERVLLDCPPGLTETSEQVLRAADLVIVPVIPSALSRRALDEVIEFLDRKGLRRGAVLPVYNMVDRRRTLHRQALEEQPDWPVVPMASAVEEMGVRRAPVGEFAARSPAAAALSDLWAAIERRLGRLGKAG